MATYDLTTTTPSSLQINDIINCPHSGTYQTLTIPKGQYKLECWGASGYDYSSSYKGGNGGYSTGILNCLTSTTLYLYVGSQGSSTGGYNAQVTTTTASSSQGGGASDIRINSTSIYARVLVAGGGGGSAKSSAGGTAGGLTGSGTAGAGTQTGFSVSKPKYSGSFGGGYSGAGGGWYGGCGGYRTSSTSSSGSTTYTYYTYGGGSGYCYNSNTASNYPEGCLLTSDNYLRQCRNLGGDVSFLSPAGAEETGHDDNGYIRITVLSNEPLESPTIYNINTDTIDTTLLKTGDIFLCESSGSIKSITLPKGIYQLECWGSAGDGYTSSDKSQGGAGGYSSGIYTINETTTLYMAVGRRSDGYNGGGSGDHYGGGATHIATATGLLSSLENNKSSILLVAGGGGGGANSASDTFSYTGGYGGGVSGGTGSADSGYGGTGGSQSSGGTSNKGGAGSFGQGGNAYNNASGNSSGGGGGYYGGGGGTSYKKNIITIYIGAGGGGSGYVSSVLTDTVLKGGNESFKTCDSYYTDLNFETGHKKQDGYIVITALYIESNSSLPIYIKNASGWNLINSIYTKNNVGWNESINVYSKHNSGWI